MSGSSAVEYREMDRAALVAKVGQLEQDLQGLKEDVRGGKEKNHTRLAQGRREIARAKTIIKEKAS